MKKFFALALALIMALSLVACGGKEEPKTEQKEEPKTEATDKTETPSTPDYSDLKIGIVLKNNTEWMMQLGDAALQSAKDLGIPEDNITMLAKTKDADVAEEIQQVESLISLGVDGLLLSPSTDEMNEVVTRAAEEGIKIAFMNSDVPSFEHANRVTFVGLSQYEALYKNAQAFAKNFLKEGDNVLVLRGALGDAQHNQRADGMKDGLEASGINVIAVQYSEGIDGAPKVVEDYIVNYGEDGIQGIMCCSDAIAQAAAGSVRNAGLLDKIKVCGFDGTLSACQTIAAGEMVQTMWQDAGKMGYDGMKFLADNLVNGTTYEPFYNTDIVVITADNAQEFIDKLS